MANNKYADCLIIIPTLNEAENLGLMTKTIFGLMPGISVLIVDDKSTDGTIDLVKKLMINNSGLNVVVRETNHGYGRSVLDGMRWAIGNNYRRVVTMDADFSHDPKTVPKILEELSSADVVLGSRYVKGGGVVRWSFWRHALSLFANLYIRIILSTKFRDFTNGFVGYGREAVAKIVEKQPKSEGYSFLVEIKYILFRNHYRIKEYPAIITGRERGQSKMSFRIIKESILTPWRLKFDKYNY